MSTSEQEQFIKRVHQARPGQMARVWQRGVLVEHGYNSYRWVAAQVERCERVLDVGGGSGVCAEEALARRASRQPWTTLDLSAAELALVDPRYSEPLLGRAQAIPSGDAAFHGVVSHLALTLMPDEEVIAAELARVLAPGGTLAAVVGGGPRVGSLLESALDLALPFACAMPRLGGRMLRDPQLLHARFSLPRWSAVVCTDLICEFPRNLVVPWVLCQYEFALLPGGMRAALAARVAAHVAAAPAGQPATAALTGVVARRIAR